jgi:voltage-gated sodium channel
MPHPQHQRLKDFAHGKIFCHIINYAIILFAILVGIETIFKSPGTKAVFDVIDYFFLTFFTIEIIIRILAEDHPGLYFVLFRRKKVTVDGVVRTRLEFTEHGFWNYFDFALISLSIFGLAAQLILHPSVIQVGRLFRIFRIIRLLEISDHLKEVERRITSIIPTVFSFAVLLIVLTYIYAILGMFMFGNRVFETCNFGTIESSFVTLFQVMTLDNWSDVMHDLAAHANDYSPFAIQIYFVSFVIFTSIIAFNVFVAVMTSQVQDKLEHEIEAKIVASQTGEDSVASQLQRSMKDLVAELQIVKAELQKMKGN